MNKKSSKLVTGVVAATLIGTTIGLLAAPNPGKDTRQRIRNKITSFWGGCSNNLMDGKAYSKQSLSMMIHAAHQYIQVPDEQREIISKCHQKIGLILAGSPPHQREAKRYYMPSGAGTLNVPELNLH